MVADNKGSGMLFLIIIIIISKVLGNLSSWLGTLVGKDYRVGSILIDRVSAELRMEVRNIAQKAMMKTIPKKKKYKKAKWLSEEALKISEKRRKANTQRRKRKIYPSECRVPKNSKERCLPQWLMERNRGKNRMEKTRYLFKEIRYRQH